MKKEWEWLMNLDDGDSVALFNSKKDKLAKLLVQEDQHWKQRAKAHWLKDGDQNTKFFHNMASWRQKRSSISKLRNEEGDTIKRVFVKWQKTIL